MESSNKSRTDFGGLKPRTLLWSTRRVRIICQGLVFATWVALIMATKHPIDSWLAKTIPVSILLRMDPLVTTVVCGGMRMGITITFLGFATIAVSFVLGRVFCGWVCPLGTVFDFYGWFMRRLKVPFQGPSPKWFTFKYYLLGVILLFAIMGGVSPLMGFDPIVLITRVAATVIDPFFLRAPAGAAIPWTVSDPPGFFSSFVDGATLLLFIAIMAATTRLSRIWCRTVCPLGAYLGLMSRNSILRRKTKDCVQCGICSTHCPTGAIDFKDATVYNESECIKCFNCTSECPVDANFFKFESPIPAFSPTQNPVSLERRGILGTVAAAAVSAPVLHFSGGASADDKKLLRPPMSRDERDFLASCIRCNECTKACPTGILKPAGLEHGLRAFWSPVMVPTEGACAQGCQACSQACPTDAILKYPLENKYKYKAGTAVFESNRCISYTEDKFCNECVRVCPTEAISFVKGWEPDGSESAKGADVPAPDGKIPTRPIGIIFDRCVGCGACEYACDQIVYGDPAMVTTSYGRGVPTSL